eukprot:jgi/Mesvir1/12496/Mv08108-RA.1
MSLNWATMNAGCAFFNAKGINRHRASVDEFRGQSVRLTPPLHKSRPSRRWSFTPASCNLNKSVNAEHLVVLANGLFGSKADWDWTSKRLQERLGPGTFVYVSEANSYLQTFEGVDVAGTRLAEEVRQISRRSPSLQSLSLVGHSLGGLICRYAAACLYSPEAAIGVKEEAAVAVGADKLVSATVGGGGASRPDDFRPFEGLRPLHYVSLSSPHLGSVQLQVPFLLHPTVEAIASPVAAVLYQRTGQHLFLRDVPFKQDAAISPAAAAPLLMRMTGNCETGKFLSALSQFQYRTAYANVEWDHIVGWRTSCIRTRAQLEEVRREIEQLRRPQRSQYRYLLRDVEGEHAADARQKGADSMRRSREPDIDDLANYARMPQDTLVDLMARRLSRVSWRRVDVSFRGTLLPYLGHHNIQVKSPVFNAAGEEVIEHLAMLLASRPS